LGGQMLHDHRWISTGTSLFFKQDLARHSPQNTALEVFASYVADNLRANCLKDTVKISFKAHLET